MKAWAVALLLGTWTSITEAGPPTNGTGVYSTKSCIGPNDTSVPTEVQETVCVGMTYHAGSPGTPGKVNVESKYGTSIMGSDELTQGEVNPQTMCTDITGCRCCIGFRAVDIADDWAELCPIMGVVCSDRSSHRVDRSYRVDLPCAQMGESGKDEMNQLAYGFTEFGFDLLHVFANEDDTFVSPFSVANILMITMLASEGDSKKQIQNALHFPDEIMDTIAENMGAFIGDLQHETPLVTSGCKTDIWVSTDWFDQLNPDYLADCAEFATFTKVDFSVADVVTTINSKIAQETHLILKSDAMIPSISPHTIMLQTNSMAFMAPFQIPFTQMETITFWDEEDGDVAVEMMEVTDTFDYMNTDKIEIIKIPFAGDFAEVSMYILRSRDDNSNTLVSVEKSLEEKAFSDHISSMQKTSMTLRLPIFEMFNVQDIADELQSLGITDVMDAHKTDMTRMFKNTTHLNAYEDTFNRVGTLTVNQHGVSSAAFTGDGMGHAEKKNGKVYHADRPFLFMIMDEQTKLMLFCGRVTNPAGWRPETPTAAPKRGHNPAGVVFGILILSFVAYCAIGYGINTQYNDLSGFEALPHHEKIESCFNIVYGYCNTNAMLAEEISGDNSEGYAQMGL